MGRGINKILEVQIRKSQMLLSHLLEKLSMYFGIFVLTSSCALFDFVFYSNCEFECKWSYNEHRSASQIIALIEFIDGNSRIKQAR